MSEEAQKPVVSDNRVLALDALRGFVMFWIIGGGKFIKTLAKITDWGWTNTLKTQVVHAEWHGFTAWDLVFPMFMFIAGVSIPYSIMGKLEKNVSPNSVLWRIVRRTVLLILLGTIYTGLLKFNFARQRYASVLGQIGVAYFIAAMVFYYARKFKLVLLSMLVLFVLVTLAQLVVPVPGYGANVLMPEGCMNGYLDRMLLPGRLFRKVYDPQGVLCMISAAGVTLIGVLTGILLRQERWNGYRKTTGMAIAGVGLVFLSLVIHPWYPVNKEIWTTTFNILTGGISLLVLAVVYLLVDVLHFTKWSFPWRVIGMNAITIYMGVRIIDFKHAAEFLFGGLASLCGNFEPLAIIAGMILLEWLFLYFLYYYGKRSS